MRSMNADRGAFHGSCPWLSIFPSFVGLRPSSRAIWTWAWERWCRLRASIQERRCWGSAGSPFRTAFYQICILPSGPFRDRRQGTAPGCGTSEGETPDRLVYLLDHEYTERGLDFARLKGKDRQRVSALLGTAERLGCEAYLALAEVH